MLALWLPLCPVRVYYDDEVAGESIAHLLVDDAVILELKSVGRVAKAHQVQLVNYLGASRKEVSSLVDLTD
ncbi:MAG: GxxExxY protein [bacterium]